MMAAVDVRAVAVATGMSVVASAVWYTALGRRLAQLDEAYAEGARPAAGVLLIEVGRSATVAAAVAVLARRTDTRGLQAASRLAAGLWVGFPAALLTGSVVHEKVPWQLAAIHGGDWLIKLVLITGVIAGRRS